MVTGEALWGEELWGGEPAAAPPGVQRTFMFKVDEQQPTEGADHAVASVAAAHAGFFSPLY